MGSGLEGVVTDRVGVGVSNHTRPNVRPPGSYERPQGIYTNQECSSYLLVVSDHQSECPNPEVTRSKIRVVEAKVYHQRSIYDPGEEDKVTIESYTCVVHGSPPKTRLHGKTRDHPGNRDCPVFLQWGRNRRSGFGLVTSNPLSGVTSKGNSDVEPVS